MGKLKDLLTIDTVDEVYQYVNSFNEIQKKKVSIKECSHENVEHQPAEYDTNVPEAYTCKDCGMDLDPPPEPDWDLLAKE